MAFERVSAGKDVPNDINVIIEIPAQSDPIKFEVDKDSGAIFVDRFMGTTMRYPLNYGYVPHTVAGDGDPVDVLVVTPFPLQPGVVIRCRPVGLLKMEDESGVDAKVVAVPVCLRSTYLILLTSVRLMSCGSSLALTTKTWDRWLVSPRY